MIVAYSSYDSDAYHYEIASRDLFWYQCPCQCRSTRDFEASDRGLVKSFEFESRTTFEALRLSLEAWALGELRVAIALMHHTARALRSCESVFTIHMEHGTRNMEPSRLRMMHGHLHH